MFEELRRLYWDIVPYDYRPHELWYRLKCFVWHRYSTVKPRTLPHTWADRDHLMVHCMFELLEKYLEKEVDVLDRSDCFIVPGQHYEYNLPRDTPDIVNVINEMKELSRWWKEYLSKEDHHHDKWHEFQKQHNSNYDKYVLNDKFDTEDNAKKSAEIFKSCSKEETKWNNELEDRLVRLLNIRQFLWS